MARVPGCNPCSPENAPRDVRDLEKSLNALGEDVAGMGEIVDKLCVRLEKLLNPNPSPNAIVEEKAIPQSMIVGQVRKIDSNVGSIQGKLMDILDRLEV